MRGRLSPLALSLLLVFGGMGPDLEGQVNRLPTRVEPRVTAPAPVPFGPGEFLRYDVRLGALGRRGEGSMRVVGLDSVRGHTTYHVSMAIQGGRLFAKVSDHYQSWFDVGNLVTRRFIQDVHQLNRERYRHFEVFPEERRFERRDKISGRDMSTDLPRDDPCRRDLHRKGSGVEPLSLKIPEMPLCQTVGLIDGDVSRNGNNHAFGPDNGSVSGPEILPG